MLTSLSLVYAFCFDFSSKTACVALSQIALQPFVLHGKSTSSPMEGKNDSTFVRTFLNLSSVASQLLSISFISFCFAFSLLNLKCFVQLMKYFIFLIPVYVFCKVTIICDMKVISEIFISYLQAVNVN